MSGATDQLSISVVMPAFNAIDSLPRSMAPLLNMRKNKVIDEIIVVDDASTDGTANYLSSVRAIKVVNMVENLGPAAARNLGAELAASDILWFIDADVIAPAVGGALIKSAFAESDVVAVFGVYDDTPAVTTWLSRYKNLTHRYYHLQIKGDAQTFWAGCGAVRKSTFQCVGGFNAELYRRPSIEDIEVGQRIARQGKILMLKGLQGKHLKHWSFINLLKTDIFDRAVPWSRLIIERSGLSDTLNISKLERLRAGIACFLAVTMIGVFVAHYLWPLAFLATALAILVNLRLLNYLRLQGGLAFALGGLAFHQFYYCYSAAAFCWCGLEAYVRKMFLRKPARRL